MKPISTYPIYRAAGCNGFDHVWKLLAGYQQVMDAYLLCLATHHGAKLLTFDSRIGALAPQGTVEVLLPKI